MKFSIELNRTGPGEVTGRIVDMDDAEHKIYEVIVAIMSTKDAQTRVLRDLARHLNWFVDLSEGGTK